jgi:tRNA nucleotidyltransferase (CCA-adding enzyme)
MYKTEKSLRNVLEERGFTVHRSAAWSNEKNLNIIIFELENKRISKARKHLGPQVERREESGRFLEKHLNASDTLAGPWIERERWNVYKTRDYVDPVSFLRDYLRGGGREIGVGSRISTTLKTGSDYFERMIWTGLLAETWISQGSWLNFWLERQCG